MRRPAGVRAGAVGRHTVAAIAEAFGVTRGTIYRALDKTEQAPIPAQLPEGSPLTDSGAAIHLQELADLINAQTGEHT